MFHTKEVKAVLAELQSSPEGLTTAEALQRLQQYGYNEIQEEKKKSPIILFLELFKSPIVWVLIAATLISAFVGEYFDAIVIGLILVLNAIMGFVQEYKAEKAIEALKRMASLKAKVLRDGREQEMDARELVPGDIIILETGNKVPADARLLELSNLQTQEATLTGESLPVKKDLKLVAENVPLGDRKNMIFSATIITKGRGKAVVCATGMKTEIGKIAKLIQTAEEPMTPLQIKLKHLGARLGALVLIIAVVIFAVGVWFHEGTVLEMFLASVALAVAAIPEGLPAVVTISLALGVQRMVKRHALVRKLPSVETLGCTTVICSDKTGTLTKNEMTVREIFVDGQEIGVTGTGYSIQGHFTKKTKGLDLLLKIGALNNDAKVEYEKEEVIGDPTEACLIVAAAKAGMKREMLEKEYPRVDEIPFDSERKRMTTIHDYGGRKIAYLKGAPDVVLKLCKYVLINGRIQPMDEEWKQLILQKNEEFANKALRVLGFAFKELRDEKIEQDIESRMVFVGLQGMIDPPREEVKEAIVKCKTAGIKVVMVTGDFIGTAKAIAMELGIEGKAITGTELDQMKNLEEEIESIGICARVDPEHKVKILEALRAKGHIVAMTGDGVNDAPALKKADIGIAMGIAGTDVAKEASKMILTDDNFASIVNAVEEGRNIYDNIRKFVEYLLSSNIGEVLTIFLAILVGFPLPLLAIHLLWINLVTDGLPALALSIDPAEPGIMQRKPRKPGENIVNRHRAAYIHVIGAIMMLGTLAVFKWYNPTGNLMYAQTMAFLTLMLFQMFNVLNYRSIDKSLFKVGVFSNIYLIGAIATSVIMQALVIHTPLQSFFKTISLTGMDWLIAIGVAATVFIFAEVTKLIGLEWH
ncbi:calcium-translocating P-type ATPase, SERCA-type, partial [Candidatus Woesearchaeota archaeon]|nr:calcium-translocating P-type ATPase, SERCA-type [Candidatus Woesearchaeota archaeon]